MSVGHPQVGKEFVKTLRVAPRTRGVATDPLHHCLEELEFCAVECDGGCLGHGLVGGSFDFHVVTFLVWLYGQDTPFGAPCQPIRLDIDPFEVPNVRFRRVRILCLNAAHKFGPERLRVPLDHVGKIGGPSFESCLGVFEEERNGVADLVKREVSVVHVVTLYEDERDGMTDVVESEVILVHVVSLSFSMI